ncbi:MAG: lactonase family protein [Phycisphaeraceae bacterium]
MSLLPIVLASLSLLAVASLCFADTGAADPQRLRVYLGTGTKHGSKGIHLATLDLSTGRLSEPDLAVEIAAPGFLAVHPNHQWMYSVGKHTQSDGTQTGGVHAFRIDPGTGKLTLLNTQPAGGDGPCYLTVDPAGRNVLVANYGSGSVAVLPIQSDGQLAAPSATIQHTGSSVNPKRQEGPHAHAIQAHPTAPFAFAADLGTDELIGYRYDSQAGTLQRDDHATVKTASGAGPRHFAFHPALDTVYLINELDSTVIALRFDADAGRFETLQTLTTLPDDFDDTNYPSEVAVHPTGRFLYGANRGHDSLAVFQIDTATGRLTPAGHVSIEGAFPRHFAIDPTGQYLIAAHQNSNDLSIFRIDSDTGMPRFTGQKINLGTPMCVLYMPEP